MKAHIYARISRDATGESLGVQRQIEDCRRKAAALGWEIAGIFQDNDLSASKGALRPGYELMLEGIRSGTVAAVVVYDLDRLTRRLVELAQFIEMVDEHGVKLANVAGDVDLSTSQGQMVAGFKGVIAQQEARRIAERTARQKQQRAESGQPLGTRFRVFGYTREWQILEDEAAVVRDVFQRAAGGESQGSITSRLRARGIRTAAGIEWRPLNTKRMLAYSKYAGLQTYKGDVIGPSTVPALVSEATFQAVQKSKPVPRQGTARRYLLSGFCVCGSCYTPMTGSNGRYRCDKAMGGCGQVSIKAPWVEQPLSRRIGGYHQQVRSRATSTPDGQELIDEADRRIEALRRAYEDGTLGLEDLVPLMQVERRARARAVTEAVESAEEVARRVLAGLYEFDDADLATQRDIVALYLERVVIKPSGKGRQSNESRSRIECHWRNGIVEWPFLEMTSLMDWRERR